ncbi:MAG: ABC transporter substrate-binding protein [Pseudomonadota bacterium]
MIKRNSLFHIIPWVLALGLALPVWAKEPTDKIKTTTDKILSIVTDPNLKDPKKAGERKKLIYSAVDECFDWHEMGRRALSIHWNKRTKEEKEEFIALFGRLMERNYLDKVEGYSGEKVNYTDETIDGDYAVVKVKIVTSKNEEIGVDYRLSKKEKGWLVYDISIEGVSLINNYRIQFSSILARSSYAELIKRLKEKVAQQ